MRFLLLFLFCVLTLVLPAQTRAVSGIHYQIDVRVDTLAHMLNGLIYMTYKNQSDTSLDFLSVQIHANAFRDQTSPFAMQNYDWGLKRDDLGEIIRRGYYKKIKFSIDSTDLEWSYNKGVKDLARIILPQTLAPGKSITIVADFDLQIPTFKGNMGTDDYYWYLANFYPAFAVFHEGKWLEYSYPALGKQVLPFADFEVTIAFPDKYEVVSNGTLLNKDKMANGFNKHVFRAMDVKEFAMVFSEKATTNQFTIKNAQGNDLQINMFLVRDSAHLINKYQDLAMQWVRGYESIFNRPYSNDQLSFVWTPTATFVQYPGLVVRRMNDALCECKWLKDNLYLGLLSNDLLIDDAADPLLIASLEAFLNWKNGGINMTDEDDESYQGYMANLAQMHQNGFSQPLSLKSTQYSYTGYSIGRDLLLHNAYNELYTLIGEEKFLEAIQVLLNTPKDRLCQKRDVQKAFESVSGKDLSWLWVDLMQHDRLPDYKVESVRLVNDNKSALTIRNVSGLKNPVTVTTYTNGTVQHSETIDGFEGAQIIELPANTVSIFLVNYATMRSERNHTDNSQLRLSKLRRISSKNQHKDLLLFKEDKSIPLRIFPAVGYNNYDGFLLGAFFHNVTFTGNPFQYSIMPMYTFRHNRVVGSGFLNYEFPVYGDKVRSVEGGLEMRSFDKSVFQDDPMRFIKINPSVSINFRNNRNAKSINRRLTLSEYWLSEENPEFDVDGSGTYLGRKVVSQWVHRLEFMEEKPQYFNPYRYKVSLQQQSYSFVGQQRGYLRLDAEYLGAFYYDKDKEVKVLARGGAFLYNTERYSSTYNNASARASLSLWGRGKEDQLYQYVMGGRSEQYGFWSQQGTGNGIFRNNIPDAFPYGQSNSYMLGVNVTAHIPFLPGWFPLKVYGDAGMTPEYEFLDIDEYKLKGHTLEYVAGLCIEYRDAIGIYFPLVQSENIGNVFKELGYLKTIGFKVSLEKLELIKLRRSFVNNNSFASNKLWF